ncbi:uncharacterized protein LAESUDRAFT_716527 [Laetiporus sulphureus 93-53]|uniref:Uncharacterized protein n=1 Tax=Laetiporus sulphureus 93-53 TaxID=1314785 RepID=A0A165CJU9_9APHY|nr:uncharacterized protein LAESUDRAFT_716527 [Laetiporus sulphureus 93-53]KZT02944.1 hypothetical protein LAESUDRAFT_716527 [Laetiporus sulphureus 93-53]
MSPMGGHSLRKTYDLRRASTHAPDERVRRYVQHNNLVKHVDCRLRLKFPSVNSRVENARGATSQRVVWQTRSGVRASTPTSDARGATLLCDSAAENSGSCKECGKELRLSSHNRRERRYFAAQHPDRISISLEVELASGHSRGITASTLASMTREALPRQAVLSRQVKINLVKVHMRALGHTPIRADRLEEALVGNVVHGTIEDGTSEHLPVLVADSTSKRRK